MEENALFLNKKGACFTLKGHFLLRKKDTFGVLEKKLGGGASAPPPPGSAALDSGLRKRRTCFCLLRTPSPSSPRGEHFLWFLKIDLMRFHRIYLLFDGSKLLFCYIMCLLRTHLPNLCPNMIHVDALDFSEWHSEKVIIKLWSLKIWRKKVSSHLTGLLVGGGGLGGSPSKMKCKHGTLLEWLN